MNFIIWALSTWTMSGEKPSEVDQAKWPIDGSKSLHFNLKAMGGVEGL